MEIPKEDDICLCGHRYDQHRMLCTCRGKSDEDCGHAVDAWDTACFAHLDGGHYCECARFRPGGAGISRSNEPLTRGRRPRRQGRPFHRIDRRFARTVH